MSRELTHKAFVPSGEIFMNLVVTIFSIIVISTISTFSFGSAGPEKIDLLGPGNGKGNSFIVVSDINKPSFKVRLYYSGMGVINKCGISLRTHSAGIAAAKDLQKAIMITRGFDDNDIDVSVVVEDKELVVARVIDPTINTAGEYFTIKTRNGSKTLQSAIASLNSSIRVEVIAEVLTCE